MLRKFKSWRRRTQIAVVVAAAFVFAGSAFAGWIIFTGGQGTAQGSFGSATATNPALTITDVGGGGPISGPNGQGSVKIAVNNVNPNNVAETITGETDTFTSTPSDCASHLVVQPSSPLVGMVVQPGGSTGPLVINLASDSSLPNDCPNGTFTLHINLTSNP
jgi:hypothetical protein